MNASNGGNRHANAAIMSQSVCGDFPTETILCQARKKLYVENEQNSVYLAIWIDRRKDIRLLKTSQSGFWIEISERIWKL